MTTPVSTRTVVVVVLSAVVVCGLLIVYMTAGAQRPVPGTPRADDHGATDERYASPPAPATDPALGDSPAVHDGPSDQVQMLPDTPDPDPYATAVAEVLFGMDYARHEPDHYTALFDGALWAGVTGQDRISILAVIGERIPTTEMWQQMRSVDQAAAFDVDAVWEPRIAERHRAAGDWPDGWQMRTVSGTQTETWQPPGEDARTSSRPVAVTIAMACPPAGAVCQLIGIGPHVES